MSWLGIERITDIPDERAPEEIKLAFQSRLLKKIFKGSGLRSIGASRELEAVLTEHVIELTQAQIGMA